MQMPQVAQSKGDSYMATTVSLKSGRIIEHKNGSQVRSYGANIVDVDTNGEVVAAVDSHGRVIEFMNGSQVRSYGSNATRVQISGGIVAVTTSNGRTVDYRNGSQVRSY
jgi:regulatory protein YycH of two-component signal transduction system YycFG